MAEKQQSRARSYKKPTNETLDEADELEALDEGEADADDDARGLTAGKGRVTPGRRNQADESEGGNAITRGVRGMGNYIEGVRGELKKVSWPTRDETRRLTIIVLTTLFIASIVLGVVISGFFNELFRLGLNNPAILLGFMVVVVGGSIAFYQFRIRRSSDNR
ncbi:MAG: preprotein translocase subunit SecE [Chloroflexota bacterium]|nr:preprotein translocase subunit SecE [Chloroflexota bacterium]